MCLSSAKTIFRKSILLIPIIALHCECNVLFISLTVLCVCCSLDLSSLLQKPVDREEAGGLKAVGSSQGLGHSLVFTNSHHQPARNGGTSSGSNSYTHATLVRQSTVMIYSTYTNVFLENEWQWLAGCL